MNLRSAPGVFSWLPRALPMLAMAFAMTLAALPFRSQAADAPSSALLDQLRAGGLIIYFRHSQTTRANQPDNDLSSCSLQRNLNEAGRTLAKDIGAAMAQKGIPVGPVLSSPYCRCKDTAELAFGRVSVAAFLETNGDPADAEERHRLAALARVLQTAPKDPLTNTVLVGHGNNLAGLQQWHGYAPLSIDEGEAVVFRPAPAGAQVVARIKGKEWARLGEK